LLFVGEQFRAAIGRYYKKSPAGMKHFPRRLEDLLDDARYPSTVHHLRRLYRDPMTGKSEWGLVLAGNGEIIGVHSLAQTMPLKMANFGAQQQNFTGSEKYIDWKFVYQLTPLSP